MDKLHTCGSEGGAPTPHPRLIWLFFLNRCPLLLDKVTDGLSVTHTPPPTPTPPLQPYPAKEGCQADRKKPNYSSKFEMNNGDYWFGEEEDWVCLSLLAMIAIVITLCFPRSLVLVSITALYPWVMFACPVVWDLIELETAPLTLWSMAAPLRFGGVKCTVCHYGLVMYEAGCVANRPALSALYVN